jgi:hypothetical protein
MNKTNVAIMSRACIFVFQMLYNGIILRKTNIMKNNNINFFFVP